MESPSITHEPENNRFVISVDGEEAGFAAYRPNPGNRDFNHTVVLEKFRGQGLSTPLIKAALDATRDEGLSITPSCPAVKRFINKNSEYRNLVGS
ncbi:putative acetyltransferase [Corynebacterium mustelae]|uniref:Putative acetyltransferase n=1 Tax=Corynebacterium mustelae TaxID=571915 RepID=A0A0G3H6V0_9CORY|nr:GNAT family N-acetyltransferase [Corynebacterium mustelae]AKK06852.1 putative acetyltransferase [Corynebacterium mustelae]